MRALGASRTSVVPGGALAGGWTRNPLWKNARAVPSLDLRFADNKTLSDAVGGGSLVTFTRASTATFVGSDGLLKTAAVDAPRFDHNPTTGESLGLLVEEARTNSIRNNTMVGAVAGTPGTLPTNWTLVGVAGLSSSVIGTGTENGIAYIDVQVNGTPTTSTFANILFDTSIAASSGQIWTSSIYVKLAAGSLTNTSIVKEIREVTAVGTFLANSTLTVTPTSAALNTQRASLTRTLNNALTTNVRPIVSFQTTNGAAIDITLRIGLPQLEQGAFATSVIPTTTATVTRAADVASITGSNFSSWYNQTEGTVFANATAAVAASILPCYASIDNGTTSERLQLRRVTNGTSPSYRVVAGGQSIDSATKTIGSPTGFNSHVLAYASSNYEGACNGTLEGLISIVNRPTATQLQIGNGAGSAAINGTIKRLVYWGQRLPNNVLQAITQ